MEYFHYSLINPFAIREVYFLEIVLFSSQNEISVMSFHIRKIASRVVVAAKLTQFDCSYVIRLREGRLSSSNQLRIADCALTSFHCSRCYGRRDNRTSLFPIW